jgi:hypothetical protein
MQLPVTVSTVGRIIDCLFMVCSFPSAFLSSSFSSVQIASWQVRERRMGNSAAQGLAAHASHGLSVSRARFRKEKKDIRILRGGGETRPKKSDKGPFLRRKNVEAFATRSPPIMWRSARVPTASADAPDVSDFIEFLTVTRCLRPQA